MNARSTSERPSNPSKLRLEDVAPPRKPAHLCEECLMVFEEHDFESPLANERPPPHQESLAALQRSAKRGCFLCSRFLDSGPRKQMCSPHCGAEGHIEEEHLEPGTITFHKNSVTFAYMYMKATSKLPTKWPLMQVSSLSSSTRISF
jgi:hypothetical protein